MSPAEAVSPYGGASHTPPAHPGLPPEPVYRKHSGLHGLGYTVGPMIYAPPGFKGIPPFAGPADPYYRSPVEILRDADPHAIKENFDEHVQKMLKKLFPISRVRLEWINWTIHEPNPSMLGSPLSTVSDPTKPFPVYNFSSPPQLLGTARVPTLNDFYLHQINGLRATFFVPLTLGRFEAGGFFLAKKHTGRRFLPDPAGFLATSTLLDGQVSNNVQLYDGPLDVQYASRFWGLNAKVVFDHGEPGEGFKLKPVLGLAYLNFQESFNQSGSYVDSTAGVVQHSHLGALAHNNIFGPTIGLRGQLEHRWFTIGAEPRFLIGPNIYDMSVTTNQFAAYDDPTHHSSITKVAFGPVFELGVYARIHLGDRFTVRVGYDLFWLSQVQRPARGIRYDVAFQGPRSQVSATHHLQDTFIQGLSLGGEYRIW